MTTADSISINVELDESEAYALAELCKRITWRDAMDMSVNREECHAMLAACDRVRPRAARTGSDRRGGQVTCKHVP